MGHMFGSPEEKIDAADGPAVQATHVWAMDLFNHGFYWEAHEAWEGLWHAFGRSGPKADFVKGLIKLSAAGVKAREGNATGVTRHARRAAELLGLGLNDPSQGTIQMGLDAQWLVDQCQPLINSPQEFLNTARANVFRALPMLLSEE